MRPNISVIIPIYNVQDYIEKCVRSLFQQTLSPLEFIFIDDCSPDKSYEILENLLDEYPNRKRQVKIIRHEVNQGVAKSRQDGINAASGEFVIHCDPDDWLELNMYEVLYQSAKDKNVDIVFCDFFLNSKTQKLISQRPESITSESILASIAGSNSKRIHGGLWNKLIKRDLYNNIEFIKGINYCEDVYVLFNILKTNHKILYIPSPYYHYRVSSHSTVRVMSLKRVQECIQLMNKIEELKHYSNEKSYASACEAKIAGLIYYLCFEGMSQTKPFVNEILPYENYLESNCQIKRLDKQYIYNFLNGHYYKALIQSKIARYRMIGDNIFKQLFKH